MKLIKNKAFTLVELLVVITILAILSVVAYQSFGWVTDKAHNSVKLKNLAIAWSKLQEFYTSENYYPMPQNKLDTNRWWYDNSIEAQPSNYIKVTYSDAEISSLSWTLADYKWGWIIYWTWTWAQWETEEKQVWAKWVFWIQWNFNKKYLKKDIYDNQLWDIKLTWEWKKMIDYWIWKFVYAVYARPAATSNWNLSWNRWSYYELATTLKMEEWEWYVTKIEWDYTSDNFSWPDKANYPETLIWLKNDQDDDPDKTTTDSNQWIPYPLDNFARQ